MVKFKIGISLLSIALTSGSLFADSCGCVVVENGLKGACGAVAIAPEVFDRLDDPQFNQPFPMVIEAKTIPLFSDGQEFDSFKLVAFEDRDNFVHLSSGQITSLSDAIVSEDFTVKDANPDTFDVREKTNKADVKRKGSVDFSCRESCSPNPGDELIAWDQVLKDKPEDD